MKMVRKNNKIDENKRDEKKETPPLLSQVQLEF